MAKEDFKEYPKWVTTPDKKRVVVQDAAEEAKVMGTAPKADAPKLKKGDPGWGN